MPSRPDRIAGLDALRACAALAVVLYHITGDAFQNQFGAKPVGDLFAFGFAGLDLFFVISGFIIVHIHATDIGHPSRLPRYLYNRLTRIFPAYWVATLLVVALGLVNRTAIPIDRITSSLLLIPDTHFILVVAWTLPQELLFYAVFALFILRPRLGALAAAVWLFGSFVYYGTDTPQVPFFLNVRHFEFAIGAAAAWIFPRAEIRRPVALLSAGLVLFAIAAIRDIRVGIPTDNLDLLAYGIGGGLILVGVAAADRAGRLPTPRWLALLGAASYSIYLTHILAFSLAARVLQRLNLPAILPAWAILLLVLPVILATGLLFHVAVERPLLRLARNTWPRPVDDRASIATSPPSHRSSPHDRAVALSTARLSD
jgi:peptidoglycan/LPS O-acetylase OafA/YrhL